MAATGLFLGLMSGTSMDGIDAALVRIDERGRCTLEGTHTLAYPPDLLTATREAATARHDDLATVARIDRDLGHLFARAATELLAAASVEAEAVRAIGSHGQTLRHDPQDDERLRFTVQVGDAATIAEMTGITTVADFRRRDIAAGGQGAPLVPLFHAAQFGERGSCRAIVNIGGIANVTLLDGMEVVAGFDSGPGNTLLDAWIERKRGDAFDRDGAWAAEHDVDEGLLAGLMSDGYFTLRGPRSTGPEHFNLGWLETRQVGTLTPGSVQATLGELTARTIAQSLADASPRAGAVFVCGGGARNTDLMRRLHRHLAPSGLRLGTTDELGLAAEWVEAAAFAWLASRTLAGLPGNAPVVTGARGPRILGAVQYAG